MTNPIDWDKKYTFGRTGLTTEYGNFICETNLAANNAANGIVAANGKLDEVNAKLDTIAAGNVDYAQLARAVCDELDRRNRDGNPETGNPT